MDLRCLAQKLDAGRGFQLFAARQEGRKKKRRRRKGFLLSVFSFINRMVILTMLAVLLRWWLQRQQEENRLLEGFTEEEAIPLDRYRPDQTIGQPQTMPVDAPVQDEAQPNWPAPEVNSSQAETAPPVPDNLALIEGIGPKISGILRSAGIRTFRQLADTDVSRIGQILQDSGLRLADPTTWPEQADLLANGNMEGLRELQSQLKAGRRS